LSGQVKRPAEYKSISKPRHRRGLTKSWAIPIRIRSQCSRPDEDGCGALRLLG
jgi:hypothetical protein